MVIYFKQKLRFQSVYTLSAEKFFSDSLVWLSSKKIRRENSNSKWVSRFSADVNCAKDHSSTLKNALLKGETSSD